MNVIVAPISYRYLDKRTAWSIGQLFSCEEPKFRQVITSPDAAIDKARSLVASEFLKPELKDFDALFFIDDDIVFRPDDAVKLANHIKNGADIVGGAYVTKSSVPQLAVRLFEGQQMLFDDKSRIEEVMYLPGGFTMVHRRVYEKMKNRLNFCFPNSKMCIPFYGFYKPMEKKINGQMEYLTEDYSFCERAKESGFKCYVDPSIRLGHAGIYLYSLEDMEIFKNGKETKPSINITKESGLKENKWNLKNILTR